MCEEQSILFQWIFKFVLVNLYTLKDCVLFDKLHDIFQELSQMQL